MARPGVYRSNDGGYYYFQSNFATGGDGRCAWFGFNPDAGWANVFFGRWVLDGQIIKGMSGDWCDIPWGRALGHGELSIDFGLGAPTPEWYRSSVSGGFGGSFWTQTNSPPPFPELPIGNRDFPDESLSGVWQSDTGALYYIRELSSGEVFWFAARPDLVATHVAKGVRRENGIRATWLDTLPGQVRSVGDLSLRVFSPHFMEKESSSASFGSSRWLKLS